MLIGTMNHPARDVLKEIEWIAGMGLDFVDLTLEPPMAAVWKIDPAAIRAALERHRLPVVGHTAYYLPICSPFESIRRAAVDELRHCLEIFAQVGARWMNIHPDHNAPLHQLEFVYERNMQSLRDLTPMSRDLGIGLMIENLPGRFNTVRQVGPLLDALPELGFHLDVGHSNLMVEPNSADELIAAYGQRLRHVHLHDNKGGKDDLHMPLGTGTLDFPHYIRTLKKSGYDGTITLEVFTPDPKYLEYSRDVLRRIWDESSPGYESRPRSHT
ncbi:MAG: Xylose isomerase domain protein barrel [Pedosphaera sp.]|nr:Xylose isomerase domain protein barrel [Pedosphaera sp.]